MKILFFGTRQNGLECLSQVLASDHEVCCVTTEDYHMDDVSSADFEELCRRHKIEMFKADKIENDEYAARYASYQADLGVCTGWKRLIGPKVLATTRHGFIGPHGSDLPRYRGFASTHWAILNGDPQCGFCIMRFKPGEADTGEICSRFCIDLDERTTIKDLLDKCRPLVAQHIVDTIDRIETGTLVTEPQDETRAVLSFPRLPDDGEIDWHDSAAHIDRLVRAVTRPYPGAFTFFKERKLFVWQAHVLKDPPRWVGECGHIVHLERNIGVLTGNGILVLDECQFENDTAAFRPGDVFKTHRLRLGMNHSQRLHELTRQVERLQQEIKELRSSTSADSTRSRDNHVKT